MKNNYMLQHDWLTAYRRYKGGKQDDSFKPLIKQFRLELSKFHNTIVANRLNTDAARP